MQKFFIDKECVFSSKVIISGDDINHILKVLRKEIGDNLEVSDGEGTSYLVRISEITKREITAEIIEKYVDEISDFNVTLYQSLPKADKMELIIQKCTELGITRIIPFVSERTVVVVDKKSEPKKLERWRKIAQEACKQCGRSVIPKIDPVQSLKGVLEQIKDYDLGIVCYEKEETTGFKEILKSNSESKDIAILIGPEGGFAESEIEEAVKQGVKAVTMGPRILRTETAGMAALCIIMYELGDMGR